MTWPQQQQQQQVAAGNYSSVSPGINPSAQLLRDTYPRTMGIERGALGAPAAVMGGGMSTSGAMVHMSVPASGAAGTSHVLAPMQSPLPAAAGLANPPLVPGSSSAHRPSSTPHTNMPAGSTTTVAAIAAAAAAAAPKVDRAAATAAAKDLEGLVSQVVEEHKPDLSSTSSWVGVRAEGGKDKTRYKATLVRPRDTSIVKLQGHALQGKGHAF